MKLANYLSLTVAVAGLFTGAAHAKTLRCVGMASQYTRGEVILSMNVKAKTASVTGAYQVDGDGSGHWESRYVNYKGQLDNTGRSGLKTHDYYEGKKTSGIDYIRVTKDTAESGDGYLDLVTRGPSTHDEVGYEYAAFHCN
jgi:hypothetical protein